MAARAMVPLLRETFPECYDVLALIPETDEEYEERRSNTPGSPSDLPREMRLETPAMLKKRQLSLNAVSFLRCR